MADRSDFGLVLDRGNPLSLQHQLRRRIVDAIERGVLPAGARLPSTRRLAVRAAVSRNTVTLAYDALVAEGFLESRPRSGLFVSAEVGTDRVASTRRRRTRRTRGFVQAAQVDEGRFRPPPNWHQYPYPFLDGCTDATLVPFDEWREVLRLSASRQELLRLAQAASDADDPMLIDELRTKVLPAWGVDARADEVTATASLRQAQSLVLDTLAGRGTAVYIEGGEDSDFWRRALERQAVPHPLRRDAHGPVVPDELSRDALIVIGARRAREGERLSIERARAWLRAAERTDSRVLECATSPEMRDAPVGVTALRALDGTGRVAFVSGLPTAVSLGAPPGFVCAAPHLLDRLRAARRAAGHVFAPAQQRAWAHFLGLGHYAAAMNRVGRILQARRTALRDALNHYLHKFVQIGAYQRSSAYWVRGPAGMNSAALSRAAASIGVLIEPGSEDGLANLCTMGVAGIGKERIRAGIEIFARLIRRDPALGSRLLQDDPLPPLRGRALQRAIGGRTLLYNTVYGDPCTIEVRRDGLLVGTAGRAGEDCDTGRWWIENDRWVRQWRAWSYGESLALHTIVEGDQVRWYNAEGLLVDTAVIVRAA